MRLWCVQGSGESGVSGDGGGSQEERQARRKESEKAAAAQLEAAKYKPVAFSVFALLFPSLLPSTLLHLLHLPTQADELGVRRAAGG